MEAFFFACWLKAPCSCEENVRMLHCIPRFVVVLPLVITQPVISFDIATSAVSSPAIIVAFTS